MILVFLYQVQSNIIPTYSLREFLPNSCWAHLQHSECIFWKSARAQVASKGKPKNPKEEKTRCNDVFLLQIVVLWRIHLLHTSRKRVVQIILPFHMRTRRWWRLWFSSLDFFALRRENWTLVQSSKLASCVFRSIVQNGTKPRPNWEAVIQWTEFGLSYTSNEGVHNEWKWYVYQQSKIDLNFAILPKYAVNSEFEAKTLWLLFLCRTINNCCSEGKLSIYFTPMFYFFSFCNALLNDIGLFFSSLQIYVANALDQNKTE